MPESKKINIHALCALRFRTTPYPPTSTAEMHEIYDFNGCLVLFLCDVIYEKVPLVANFNFELMITSGVEECFVSILP